MRCLKIAIFIITGFPLLIGHSHAVDVPTWQLNDHWDLTRTFDFNVTASSTLSMEMTTTETVRLTVTDIGDRTTTESGTVRVYRRARSNGSITGRGVVTMSGIPVNVRWKPGSASAGEQWLAVGDLGAVREQFAMSAILQAQVLIWITLATITLDTTTDYGPPAETFDFPIQTVGEEWRTSSTQHTYGRVRVAFNQSFPLWPGGAAPADVDMPFDRSFRAPSFYSLAAIEPHAGQATTYRIETPTSSVLWYAPAFEDVVEASIASVELTSGSQMTNVYTRITGASLAADPNLSAAVARPDRVEWGDRFQLLGATAPGTTVTATILDTGTSATVVSSALDGQFEIRLQAPAHNDHSPASDDQGSFGIELAAQGVGRKVLTLQVYRPASNTSRAWRRYR